MSLLATTEAKTVFAVVGVSAVSLGTCYFFHCSHLATLFFVNRRRNVAVPDQKAVKSVEAVSVPTKKPITVGKVTELEVVDSLMAELVDIISAGEDEQILSGE
jgi:hypothetical protein